MQGGQSDFPFTSVQPLGCNESWEFRIILLAAGVTQKAGKTRAQKPKTCCKRLDLCRSALVCPVVAEPWPVAKGSLGPRKLCLEGILAPLLAGWLVFLAESSLPMMVQTSVGKLAPPEMAAIRSKVTIVTRTAYFSR